MSEILDEIRRLYFETTQKTITNDFDKAIDLLKSLETPEERQKATVYMAGLAEMRKEWGEPIKKRTGKPRPGKPGKNRQGK